MVCKLQKAHLSNEQLYVGPCNAGSPATVEIKCSGKKLVTVIWKLIHKKKKMLLQTYVGMIALYY